jgi:putative transcriptional regulator
MPKARIRNQIRRLRFDHGEMTQQHLADLVGCTRQTIIVLEKERYVPSLSLAFEIARVFERNIEDVFTYVDGPERDGSP